MLFEVTFRNMNAREEVRTRGQALFEKLEKFLDPAATGQLTVAVEHGHAVIEIVVTSRGRSYTITQEDADLRTALDRVFHNLENQLRRAKEKRNKKGRSDPLKGGGEAPSLDNPPR